MNDRFKFRVFGLCCNSKLEKNWVNITEVGNFFIDKDGNLIDSSAYFDPINHPEHFIVEQCTGLKDKNGNLIYEGDLLTDGRDIGHVLWRGSGWGCTAFLWKKKPETLEICGNIHEQAEQKDK